MNGRVLIVAGSDSGGGAGIQADIKAVTALGAYAATAVTALTAQDTLGVHDVLPVPLPFVRQQIELSLADIGADAVKTGMLADAATVELVAAVLAAQAPGIALVVDPVMVAKGGAALADTGAVASLRRHLLPMATLITPNVPEAEALSGHAIHDTEGMRRAGAALLSMGAKAVLVKGGHLPGAEVTDLLLSEHGAETFIEPRIETVHTHGTGCTLASAIAAGLAQGMPLFRAVRRARTYVQRAIATAPGFGRGHGPLNHAVTVDPGMLDRPPPAD